MKKKRIGAYCRVSTELETQKTSLSLQMEAFQALIHAHPDWELVETYVDEGLTGTTIKNRRAFQKMMADAEAGKLDYIVTKSLSRFARNTLDALEYTRKLKEHGVYVLFEKDHLDTGSGHSELVMSVLAAVAQEESRSISENLKWGIRKRFQEGRPSWRLHYGYCQRDRQGWIIDEAQAVWVRRIFELYADGCSLPEIVRFLQESKAEAEINKPWSPTVLSCILHNESYAGDIRMQKHYIADYLTHRQVRNDGTMLPMYYVRNHHPAIVERDTFETVQMVLAMKDNHRGVRQYPYYGFLFCPICGERMVRFSLPSHGHQFGWTCGGKRTDAGIPKSRRERTACPPYVVREQYIDTIVRDAFATLDMSDLHRKMAVGNVQGKAAERAIEWKIKGLEIIQYSFLHQLIDRISFSKWSDASIVWRLGQTSHVPVHYRKVNDIPGVIIREKDGEYTANGQLFHYYGERMQAAVFRLHKACNELMIMDSDPVYGTQIPCVYGNESTKKKGVEEQ